MARLRVIVKDKEGYALLVGFQNEEERAKLFGQDIVIGNLRHLLEGFASERAQRNERTFTVFMAARKHVIGPVIARRLGNALDLEPSIDFRYLPGTGTVEFMTFISMTDKSHTKFSNLVGKKDLKLPLGPSYLVHFSVKEQRAPEHNGREE